MRRKAIGFYKDRKGRTRPITAKRFRVQVKPTPRKTKIDFNFDAIKHAKAMKMDVVYYPDTRSPIYVEIIDRRHPEHVIHVGYDQGYGYFVNTSIGGKPLWDKRHLTRSEADRVIMQSLSGRDISEAIP
jgi:hypothetical protein